MRRAPRRSSSKRSSGLSDDWQQFVDNSTLDFDAGGDLRCAMGTDPIDGGCAIQTSTYYDLREQSVTIRIKEFLAGSGDDTTVVFEAESRTGRGFLGLTADHRLSATFDVNGMPQTPIAVDFDLARHAYVRLRGTADDVLIFETSGDGLEFEAFAATTAPGGVGPLDAVRIAIGLFGLGGANGPFLSLGGINAR